MTAAPPPIVSGPVVDSCPLCRKRTVGNKRIYGHPVCRKCYYAFANRRQLAYLVDALLFFLPAAAVDYVAELGFRRAGLSGLGLVGGMGIVSLAMGCLFVMKDGFAGYSPGKWLADVRVLDQTTHQPIEFGQSFKRNAILLVGQIPVPILGPLVALVITIIIAVQLARGYRLGDRWANTRVIWNRFARLEVFGGSAILCEGCGYDLHGNVSGVCPECGVALSPRNSAKLAGAVAHA